jgi:hypothetical protein
MGLIARPAKEGGFLTYVEKRLAGFEFILDSEADADFAAIYDAFNGNITNENVSDTAGIAVTKLALNSAIGTTQLTDGGVTTAKLADDAVTPAKVAPLGYSTGNCVPNAVITTETELASAAITVIGGPVLLLPNVGTAVTLVGVTIKTVTWRWKRDGTLIGAVILPVGGFTGGQVQVPCPGPPSLDAAPTAGLHTYSLTVETTAAAIATTGLFPGGIIVKELVI